MLRETEGTWLYPDILGHGNGPHGDIDEATLRRWHVTAWRWDQTQREMQALYLKWSHVPARTAG